MQISHNVSRSPENYRQLVSYIYLYLQDTSDTTLCTHVRMLHVLIDCYFFFYLLDL
jgi:hypothetical protein